MFSLCYCHLKAVLSKHNHLLLTAEKWRDKRLPKHYVCIACLRNQNRDHVTY